MLFRSLPSRTRRQDGSLTAGARRQGLPARVQYGEPRGLGRGCGGEGAVSGKGWGTNGSCVAQKALSATRAQQQYDNAILILGSRAHRRAPRQEAGIDDWGGCCGGCDPGDRRDPAPLLALNDALGPAVRHLATAQRPAGSQIRPDPGLYRLGAGCTGWAPAGCTCASRAVPARARIQWWYEAGKLILRSEGETLNRPAAVRARCQSAHDFFSRRTGDRSRQNTPCRTASPRGTPGRSPRPYSRADRPRPLRQSGFLCKCKTHRNPRPLGPWKVLRRVCVGSGG